MRAIRTLIALVFGLILIVVFHRAVASELPSLEPLMIEPVEDADWDCDNLSERLADFRAEIESEYAQLGDFVDEVFRLHDAWYAKLSPFEGQTVQWPDAYFEPLIESAEAIAVTSDMLFEVIEANDLKLDSAEYNAAECRLMDDSAQAHFDEFRIRNAEHLGTTAEYLSQMASALHETARDWSDRHTGGEKSIPQGAFTALSGFARDYVDAARYVRRNGELSVAEYVEFLRLLGELARVPPQR